MRVLVCGLRASAFFYFCHRNLACHQGFKRDHSKKTNRFKLCNKSEPIGIMKFFKSVDIKIRKTAKAAALAAAMAVLMQVQTAQADLTNSLYYLANTPGATLSIGDKTFSGFTYLDDGLTSFNASNILVTASQVGGSYLLTWGGNISFLNVGGVATADLLLNYTVSASDGNIFAIDQNYTGTGDPAGGTFLEVTENAYAPGDPTAAASSFLDETNDATTFTDVGAVLTPAQPVLNVTKDISFGVIGDGLITISQVEQSFEQVVPEPTSLALAVFGGLGMLLLRRRK
jgi:hypothetical protein